MKKILAIFLALVTIMSVALVACNKKNNTTNTNDDDEGEDFVIQTKGEDTDDTGTDTKDSNDDDEDVFNDFTASRTIWAMTGVNLRSAPSMGENVDKIGVAAGTELTAISKSASWYKITYNNETRYVSADYVTETKAESQFNILDEADYFDLTIKPSGNNTPNQINLRTKPVFDKTLATTTLKETDVTAEKKLTVVGMNATGTWYIVSYNNEETPYFLAITSSTRPYLNGLPTQGGEFGG